MVRGWTAVLWVAASLFAVQAPATGAEIKIRADEWLPYNGGTSLNPPGYMIEMAQSIAKRHGHEIDYRHMPWEAALAAVRDGQFDCVVGAYKSDAEGFAFPARGWGKANNTFFALNDQTWRYTGIESLDNVTVGVAEGYSYGEDIDAYIEKYKADAKRVVVVPVIGRAIVKMIARLIGKRIDVFLEDTNVAAYGLTQGQIEPGRIVPVGAAGEAEDVYIACTPAAPRGREFADMFDKGLDELTKSGELATILKKYGVQDWTQAEAQ